MKEKNKSEEIQQEVTTSVGIEPTIEEKISWFGKKIASAQSLGDLSSVKILEANLSKILENK